MLRIHHGLITTIATARQMAFVFQANREPNDRSLPGRISRTGVVRMNIVRAASSPPMAMPDAIARVIVQPSLRIPHPGPREQREHERGERFGHEHPRIARQLAALQKDGSRDDRGRDAGELRGDDGGSRDRAGRDAAVDDAPCREIPAGDGIHDREKVRHRRRAIGGRIVLGLAAEQQPVSRNPFVRLAPVLVAPLVAESTSLPDVEGDRVVVVAVTRSPAARASAPLFDARIT